jgi:hypothetical protein
MVNLLKRVTMWVFIINLFTLLYLYRFTTELYSNVPVYPNHLHTTIYIDSSFGEFEQNAIMEAALEWTTTTNHIIEYDVVRLPTNEEIDMDHSIIISKATPDHPNVIALDATNKRTTLGLYDRQTIIPSIILVNQRIANEDYKPVVMHELGHSLGLQHNQGVNGMDTLMYPSRYSMFQMNAGHQELVKSGADHLTLKDGQQLCKLYHCNALKLKYQEESLHP